MTSRASDVLRLSMGIFLSAMMKGHRMNTIDYDWKLKGWSQENVSNLVKKKSKRILLWLLLVFNWQKLRTILQKFLLFTVGTLNAKWGGGLAIVPIRRKIPSDAHVIRFFAVVIRLITHYVQLHDDRSVHQEHVQSYSQHDNVTWLGLKS